MGYLTQITQVTAARTHCRTRKGGVYVTASRGNAANRKMSTSIDDCLAM